MVHTFLLRLLSGLLPAPPTQQKVSWQGRAIQLGTVGLTYTGLVMAGRRATARNWEMTGDNEGPSVHCRSPLPWPVWGIARAHSGVRKGTERLQGDLSATVQVPVNYLLFFRGAPGSIA